MIIVLKQEVNPEDLKILLDDIKKLDIKVQVNEGVDHTVLALLGNTQKLSTGIFETYKCVYKAIRVQEPYKQANKLFHPEGTVVEVAGKKIGGNNFVVIAGPCSVESEEQIIKCAIEVKAAGATFLRGGAYKPRTSPYSFQGLGEEGLKYLAAAKAETGLPIVSELMSMDTIDQFMEHVDIIQVGTRNMANFTLLKELGKVNKPILLKRGMSATLEEWLMSAEYIMSEGNEKVILCERGIRTFEKFTRNTLDLSCVPAVKRTSHLPIIIDPSHASGHAWMVDPLSRASIAVGADGVMIEVHPDPSHAKSDGEQSLTPEAFKNLMNVISPIADVVGKPLYK